MVRWPRFFLLIISFALPASAQSRVECGALNSRILSGQVRYCMLLPHSYDTVDAKHPAQRYPILYFLHGLGDNEQTLFKSGGLTVIDDFREQHKLADFLIVTPEAQASFYVNSADGKVRYSDFFLEEFMPYIETKYRVRRERKARAITGISMGGYGALHFAFAHPELFSAVSAESAALMTDSPQQLSTAFRSDASLARLMGPVFGNPVNAAHWEQNDPIMLAKKNRSEIQRLAIYFNCGDRDDYNFEVGAEKLHQELQAEGIKHEYHLYHGNHGVGYFLSHLGEVLEFHDHAFKDAK